MRAAALTSLWIALTLLVVGCGRAESHGTSAAREDVALTTCYPLQYFASRVAGGLVRVECPLPAGADPAFWQPSEAELARYQHAALVLVNGAGFERWVAGASLPFSRTRDTAADFSGEFIHIEGAKHSHGTQGEHSHDGTDGHTWLDPENARRQAQSVLLAMAKCWPEHERAFRDNGAALDAELAALDSRLRELSSRAEVRVFASHPAYNYLARRYGWALTNIDFPPDEAPTVAHLDLLVAQTAKARIMLFEQPPIAEVVRALESRGVRAVVFSPAESPDTAALNGRDYLKIMHDNIDRLGEAVGSVSSTRSPE